uniref:Putative secreted protein n=1 Tax=Ixodes ricinus TaxID=34613 RepID=A0A6B0UIK2_IXORI
MQLKGRPANYFSVWLNIILTTLSCETPLLHDTGHVIERSCFVLFSCDRCLQWVNRTVPFDVCCCRVRRVEKGRDEGGKRKLETGGWPLMMYPSRAGAIQFTAGA